MSRRAPSFQPFLTGAQFKRRVTIVCTIGPACANVKTLCAMAEAGMEVVRLNFSHGDLAQKTEMIRLVREAERKLGQPLSILQDLQGPKLRVGEFPGGGSAEIKTGSTLVLTSEPCACTAGRVYVNYRQLAKDIRPGDAVLLADGSITLRAAAVKGGDVMCDVIHGGMLSSRKGVNLPGVRLSIPALTAKDVRDVRFGCAHGVDWIALSFVREAGDIGRLRALVAREAKGRRCTPLILAKIEKPEAVDAIAGVMDAADALMVARGDLGVELTFARVPVIQKELIHRANQAGKPVVTATQMLESMIHAPLPTRAEASDVANAVFDGTDAVMLSGESAVGAYPVEAVATLARIIAEAEASPVYAAHGRTRRDNATDAVAAAAVDLAAGVDASCIVAFTRSGATARSLAQYRPMMPVLALCSDACVGRQLLLSWNIRTRVAPLCRARNEYVKVARAHAAAAGMIAKGKPWIVVAGTTRGSGGTNWMQVER